MADMTIKYEIIENYGVLATSPKGWTKEVNLIRWNEKPAKIDIRDWAPEHKKAGKGITLTDEEGQKLIEILQAAL